MIPFSGGQKIELPFSVSRHPSPTLLVAVYRFYRGPEQLGRLGLRLVQFFAELNKLFAFQKTASRNTAMIIKGFPFSVRQSFAWVILYLVVKLGLLFGRRPDIAAYMKSSEHPMITDS